MDKNTVICFLFFFIIVVFVVTVVFFFHMNFQFSEEYHLSDQHLSLIFRLCGIAVVEPNQFYTMMMWTISTACFMEPRNCYL